MKNRLPPHHQLDYTSDIDAHTDPSGADSERPAFDETQSYHVWKAEKRQPTSWESAPSYTRLQLPTDISWCWDRFDSDLQAHRLPGNT